MNYEVWQLSPERTAMTHGDLEYATVLRDLSLSMRRDVDCAVLRIRQTAKPVSKIWVRLSRTRRAYVHIQIGVLTCQKPASLTRESLLFLQSVSSG